jgi:hypothetical protein
MVHAFVSANCHLMFTMGNHYQDFNYQK